MDVIAAVASSEAQVVGRKAKLSQALVGAVQGSTVLICLSSVLTMAAVGLVAVGFPVISAPLMVMLGFGAIVVNTVAGVGVGLLHRAFGSNQPTYRNLGAAGGAVAALTLAIGANALARPALAPTAQFQQVSAREGGRISAAGVNEVARVRPVAAASAPRP